VTLRVSQRKRIDLFSVVCKMTALAEVSRLADSQSSNPGSIPGSATSYHPLRHAKSAGSLECKSSEPRENKKQKIKQQKIKKDDRLGLESLPVCRSLGTIQESLPSSVSTKPTLLVRPRLPEFKKATSAE
jgi:hypothetical protein